MMGLDQSKGDEAPVFSHCPTDSDSPSLTRQISH